MPILSDISLCWIPWSTSWGWFSLQMISFVRCTREATRVAAAAVDCHRLLSSSEEKEEEKKTKKKKKKEDAATIRNGRYWLLDLCRIEWRNCSVIFDGKWNRNLVTREYPPLGSYPEPLSVGRFSTARTTPRVEDPLWLCLYSLPASYSH